MHLTHCGSRFLYIADSSLEPRGFYREVLSQFGITPAFYQRDARRQFDHVFMDAYENQGKQPVLVIDEAHLLSAFGQNRGDRQAPKRTRCVEGHRPGAVLDAHTLTVFLQDINTEIPDGKLLLAALGVLMDIRTTDTPDEVLAEVVAKAIGVPAGAAHLQRHHASRQVVSR